jgi:hypothetical protein
MQELEQRMEQLPKERREFPHEKTINYLCVLCVSAVSLFVCG